MKYYNKFCLGVLAVSLMASCAEESKLDFMVDKPESIAQFEYLRDYDVLKSYVDRSANPGFKLGAGVAVSDFNAKAWQYAQTISNFDEVTAGWEMKHGGVIQDDGSFNLTNVNNFIATAKDATISVYGHTLCWHAGQNAKYLNSTVAPFDPTMVIWDVLAQNDFETADESYYSTSANNAIKGFTAVGEGYNGVGRALTITNSAVRTNDWESQFYITFPKVTAANEQYTLSFNIRSDAPANFGTQAHVLPGGYKHWDFFGQVSSTTTWAPFSKTVTITSNTAGCSTIAFNLGKTATTFYFDNIKVTRRRPLSDGTYELISEANFEIDNESSYEFNNNAIHVFTANGEGANNTGRALKITNTTVRTNDWECQLFFKFPAMKAGEKYRLTMDIKADVACSFATQAQKSPGNYLFYAFFGNVNATTSWTKFSSDIVVSSDVATAGTVAFNLGKFATNFYFDNIKLNKEIKPGGLEKTPDEKKAIVANEMDRWIKGIMGATKDYVKAWDVVNEPMDDNNPYVVKTGVGKTLASDEFYWQDYLGKQEYAVNAFKLAMQYGNAEDKLFINDYNLESNIDKCKGLIAFVQEIEGKGARVDGIGTQMHISTTTDKAKIAEMFTLLAQTGKLIKISELDCGIADGTLTKAATDDDYKAQSDMYNYVIKKYFEIIPASQRYGITFWSPLDSPSGSKWRAGQPIGLWTEGYSRKRAYGGAADAFAGK